VTSVGVLVVLAVIIRMRGVSWGLPYLYDPDEHYLVDPAVRFVITGDLNPHWFAHPGSTVIYSLGLAYFVYWLIGHALGWFPDLQSFATLLSTNPTSFYLIGRMLNIFYAALAIPLTYAICTRMAGRGAAVLAAALVALSPLHAEISRVLHTDPLMTTCLLAAMLFGVKSIENQSGKNFFLTGTFVGLATATKFPGMSGAMIAALAAALAKPLLPVSWTRRVQWMAIAGAGGAIGFLAAAPFIFTGLDQVYWTLLKESSNAHVSATGGRGLPNYVWYISGPLRDAVGWPLELMALVGLVTSLRGRQRPRLLLAGFALVFLLSIGLSTRRWDRWIVPLMPYVAILAAIGLETIIKAIPRWKDRPMVQNLAIPALGLLLMAPSAIEAFQRGVTLDTRDIAKAWIEAHVSPGAKVAVEQYTPPISRDDYHVFVAVRGELERDATATGFKGILAEVARSDAFREKGIDYVIVSSWFERFQAEEASYPKEVRFYNELFGNSDVVYELTPTGWTKGPVIRVLKLRT
jgi:4-amino-4-deoxy-L-arabinose transferase-like glycosyltransferase